jgi:uncharacterized membrane protein HdeD (DUF308 family)
VPMRFSAPVNRNYPGDPRPVVWSYALVDGILNVIAFIRVASHQWALLLEGVIGLISGILTFVWPAITTLVLLDLIAFLGGLYRRL